MPDGQRPRSRSHASGWCVSAITYSRGGHCEPPGKLAAACQHSYKHTWGWNMNQRNRMGGKAAYPAQTRASGESDSRLTHAMNEYFEALEAGRPVDRDAHVARYPEIAEELRRCLDGIDFIHQVAPQLSEVIPEEEQATTTLTSPAAALGD